jgi:copper(I)-binding protein
MKRLLLALVLLLLGLAACQPGVAGEQIVVTDAWARPAAAGDTTGLFFIIDNQGGEADALLGVTSDVARVAELHKTEMQDGVMKMIPQPSVAVPAGERVTFQPGGLHVMLIDLKHALNEGDEITATLRFERAGEVTITAKVTMK